MGPPTAGSFSGNATKAARTVVADDTADPPAPADHLDLAPNATDADTPDGSTAAAALLPQDPDTDPDATHRFHPHPSKQIPLPTISRPTAGLRSS